MRANIIGNSYPGKGTLQAAICVIHSNRTKMKKRCFAKASVISID